MTKHTFLELTATKSSFIIPVMLYDSPSEEEKATQMIAETDKAGDLHMSSSVVKPPVEPKAFPGGRRIWARIDVQSTAVLMTLAIIVGLGTGLAAVLFIKAIGLVTHFSFEQGLPQLLAFMGPAWIVVVPILGALISGPMIAFWAMEAKGHGVPEVLTAVIMRGGHIRPRVALVKSIASTFCIGSGGSAGREGPIVQVGSALGSTAAQVLGLGTERTITLVACGAAAGIAATFNAPIAGVVFAMEVILGEFTTHYFGMVVISAVAASIVSRHFLGANPAFVVPSYELVSAGELPFYVVLGVLAALRTRQETTSRSAGSSCAVAWPLECGRSV
jgi:CIC family chloride channel protein